MRQRFPSVYTRGSLDRFTLKERLTIRFADIAFSLLVRIVGATLRYDSEGEQHLTDVERSGRLPILTFWHDRIFAGVYYFRNRNIVVLSSPSADGEMTARFITRFGYGVIRGSSSRGSVRGLIEMIRLMRAGVPMAFSIDGPRGPRYVAKSGPVLLAKKTGNPILPFVVECKSFWTINSWDRLQIPRPLSRVKVIFAAPIEVPADANDEMLEAKRIELQNSLDNLVEKGEQWRRDS